MSGVAGDEFTAAMGLKGLERFDALGALGRKQVDAAIDYYEHNVASKRFAAKVLRAGALLLGVLASLVPLIVSLVFSVWRPEEAAKAKDWITLSAILAIVALGLVAIDRLFGASTSWIRFITSSLDLRARRSNFSVNWSKHRLHLGDTDDPEKLLAALQYLESFIASIDEIVRAETQAWVLEFRGALDELDKRIEAQRAQHESTVQERGALEVSVSNLLELDERKVFVRVDGKELIERTGASSVVVAGLPPGLVRVAVSGTKDKKPVSIEKACTIQAGQVVRLEAAVR